MQGEAVVYSGVWDKNIDDQMWSCHFGKSLEQINAINMALQMSEEGSYLPCRIAKVSHSSRILYTCIWKVPLNYYEQEEHISDSVNVECDEHTVIRSRPKFEWTEEQIEIIKTFPTTDQQWKFQYETFVDYNMSQNQLHDRCQKLARLGYRVDQIIGI